MVAEKLGEFFVTELLFDPVSKGACLLRDTSLG
jgi:hypothetical protein